MSNIFVIETSNKFQYNEESDDNDEEYENNMSSEPKINITFNHTQGTTNTMAVNYEITIDTLIRMYYIKVGRPELISNKFNEICFLYNATKLKLGDERKVKDIFKNVSHAKIVVNDLDNIIGA